ncbi:MAG: hypothetical protein ACOY3L_10715 [Pseudomonadota bacterium]
MIEAAHVAISRGAATDAIALRRSLASPALVIAWQLGERLQQAGERTRRNHALILF